MKTSHLYCFVFQWHHWAWIPASYSMDDHLQPGVPIKTLPQFSPDWHLNFEERTSIKNIKKSTLQHLVWIDTVVLVVCTWIRVGRCMSDIQREKKNPTELERFTNSQMKWYIFNLQASRYSSEAFLYCDRLENSSTICLFKLSLKDSGGSFSSEETCAVFFTFSLYPSHWTENILCCVSFNVC